jgi:hypothetical protein
LSDIMTNPWSLGVCDVGIRFSGQLRAAGFENMRTVRASEGGETGTARGVLCSELSAGELGTLAMELLRGESVLVMRTGVSAPGGGGGDGCAAASWAAGEALGLGVGDMACAALGAGGCTRLRGDSPVCTTAEGGDMRGSRGAGASRGDAHVCTVRASCRPRSGGTRGLALIAPPVPPARPLSLARCGSGDEGRSGVGAAERSRRCCCDAKSGPEKRFALLPMLVLRPAMLREEASADDMGLVCSLSSHVFDSSVKRMVFAAVVESSEAVIVDSVPPAQRRCCCCSCAARAGCCCAGVSNSAGARGVRDLEECNVEPGMRNEGLDARR